MSESDTKKDPDNTSKKEKDQKADDKKATTAEKSGKETSKDDSEKANSSDESDKKNTEASSEKTESAKETEKKKSEENSEKSSEKKESSEASEKTTAADISKNTSLKQDDTKVTTAASEKTTSAKEDDKAESSKEESTKDAKKAPKKQITEEGSEQTISDETPNTEEEVKDTEEVSDKLKVDNYRIWINGEELKPGAEVKDGDELTLAFDWKRINNDTHLVYQFPITIKNIKIDEKENASLKAEGEEIGTYDLKEVTEDGKRYLQFNVKLDKEKIKNHSNIGGGVILSGVVDINADKTLSDGSPTQIEFGGNTIDVTYQNKGDFSFKKSGGELQEDGSITYVITVDYKDIIKNPVVTDTVDENTVLLPESFKITYKEDNGDESDITDSLKASLTFSEGGSDNHHTGFSLTLPDSKDKKIRRTYTISYAVSVWEDADFSSYDKEKYIKITNNADIKYVDDHEEPQHDEDSVDTKVNKPSVDKTGTFLTDKDGKPAEVSSSGIQKFYWTKWTISLDLKDYQNLIAKNISVAEINDEFGEKIKIDYNDIGVYFSLFSNYEDYGNYINIFKGLYSNDHGQQTAIDTDDAKSWLENARQLLSEYIAVELEQDNNKYPFIYKDGVTLENFDYDETTKKYIMTYVIPMPSEGFSTRYLTATNTIKMKIFGEPVEKTTTITATVPNDKLLIKGPIDYDSGPTYDAKFNDGAGNISYSKTLSSDERYTTVDWLVGVNPKKLNQTNILSSIDSLTVTDTINNAFFVANNPDGYAQRQQGDFLGSINLEDIRIAVIHDSNIPKVDDIDQSYYEGWMKNLQDYYKSRNDAYVEMQNAIKNFDDLLNAYNEGSVDNPNVVEEANSDKIKKFNTYNEKYSDSIFLGELTFKDFIEAGGDIKVISGSQNSPTSISITIPNEEISYKKYIYNRSGEISPNSSTKYSLKSIIENHQIVIYIPTEIKPNAVISSDSTSIKNDSRLDITPNGDGPITDFPTYVVNAQYNISQKLPDNDPGTVTVSKSSGDLTLKDNTFAYNDSENNTVGWFLRANMNNAKDGDSNTLTLKDTLPEGLNYDAESMKVFVSTSTSNKQTNTSFSDNELPEEFYSIKESDGIITIEVYYNSNLSEFFKERLGENASNKYIIFYFRTTVDDSQFFKSSGKTITFKNTVESKWCDKPISQASSSVKLSFPQFMDKNTVDTEGKITGTPVVDDANGVISANYQLDINPEAASVVLDEEGKTVVNGTYTVTDKMTKVMVLEKASIKVTDADSGKEVSGWSYQYDEGTHTLTLTVPDGI